MAATDSVDRAHAIETPAAEVARESSARIQEILGRVNGDSHVLVHSPSEPHQSISIPLSVLRLLAHILHEMAEGHGITLMPVHAELNLYEAARELKVSRPFLLDLLNKGEIPSRKIGQHHRIVFKDLIAYKQKTLENRAKALTELSALDQELGLE